MRVFGKKDKTSKAGAHVRSVGRDPVQEDPNGVRETPEEEIVDRRGDERRVPYGGYSGDGEAVERDAGEDDGLDEPPRKKILPDMNDTSDLHFGAMDAPISAEPAGNQIAGAPEETPLPAGSAPTDFTACVEGGDEVDGDAELLPAEMEDRLDDAADPFAAEPAQPAEGADGDAKPEYPLEPVGWNPGSDPMGAADGPEDPGGGASPMDTASAQDGIASGFDGDQEAVRTEEEPPVPSGQEPVPAQPVQEETRFEPVIDVEPVPPDLTFASLSSIMNASGGPVWIALVDDPGVGFLYEMEDALLKYGNCRVKQVDSVVADGAVQMVYRVMLRKEPVSGRLQENKFPLPYDVPCWRIGNEAVLYMSLQPNGNGVAPAREAVQCRIFDAVRGEDGATTVTVKTAGGTVIEGIPIDRLFLPGIGPSDEMDLSDDEICERLADAMSR